MDAVKFANAVLFLSTLSLRRATLSQSSEKSTPEISIHALLAESDADNAQNVQIAIFLSTLSLRRATAAAKAQAKKKQISIHALLAESDSKSAQNSGALLRI